MAQTSAQAPMQCRLEWIAQQPTPYADHLFSIVANAGMFTLNVNYIDGWRPTHPWTKRAPRYSHRLYRRILGLDWRLLSRMMRRDRLVVFGGWHEPTIQLGLLVRALLSLPYAIWTDTPRKVGTGAFERIRAGFIRYVGNRARAVLATGKPAMAALAEVGIAPSRLRNFPYVVDTAHFSPLDAGNERDVIRVVTVARLVEDKGLTTAISALSAARPLAGKDIEYVIAGVGPLLDSLRAEAQRSSLRVNFVGWATQADLPALYRSADIYLHPATYEPYGVAVIEALSCGLPVMGSDATAAVADRVTDGVNGWIFRAGDVESLSRTLVRAFAARPQELDAMRAAARASALDWTEEDALKVLASLCNPSRESHSVARS